MIHVIIGTNFIQRQKSREKIIQGLGGSEAFSYLEIDGELCEEVTFKNALGSHDLFGKPTLVFVRGGLSRDEIKKILDEDISRFEQGNDVLIIENETITKPVEKIFKSAGAEFYIHDDKEFKVRPPTLFSLTDACLLRDKKNAWIEFVRARDRGASAEEMHGLLWWQYKTLALVHGTPTKDLASLGVSPYVIKKTQGALRKYSKDDIRTLLDSVISMMHESRRSSKELFHQIELFILEKA